MPGLEDIPGVHTLTIPVAGQGTAGTADEFVGPAVPFACLVTAAYWTPAAAVTANATHYFTVTVRNRSTGAGANLPATRSYAATDSVAVTRETMTLGTEAARTLAAGDVLTVEKLITGNGIAMPDGMVTVQVQAL